jgi:hypothetical protein
VNHPREIDDIFDRISYSKGASIIRMLQTFMGAEVRVCSSSSIMIFLKYYAANNLREIYVESL